jgi:2',3'-cyclic-nucleotide 2'-phosphodiesterase (5'-nucleotidase family)
MRPGGVAKMRKIVMLMVGALMVLPLWAVTQTIKNPQNINTDNILTESNQWAQVMVDSMRSQAKTDAAFLAAGFFADVALPAGDIPISDVIKVLQYPDDQVVVLTLRGEQIKAAFERSLGLLPQRNSAFLQVSGMKVEYNPKAASGSRVTSITIGDRDIVPTEQYTIATSAPLARGALGYFRIWEKSQITRNTEQTIEEGVKGFLADKKTLPLDNKPRVIGKP